MPYAKDMLVCDIVDSHPKAKDVLLSFGLPCYRCVVAFEETLEEGLRPHGIAPDDVLAKLDSEAPRPEHPKRKKQGKNTGS